MPSRQEVAVSELCGSYASGGRRRIRGGPLGVGVGRENRAESNRIDRVSIRCCAEAEADGEAVSILARRVGAVWSGGHVCLRVSSLMERRLVPRTPMLSTGGDLLEKDA